MAQLRRPFIACWLKETCQRTCGVSCCVSLNLQSTVLLQRALGRCHQSRCLGSCHAHHWMWWCRLAAMQVLVTLCSTCRSCWSVLETTWRRPRSTRSSTMITTIDTRSMQLEIGCFCPLATFTWQLWRSYVNAMWDPSRFFNVLASVLTD